MESLKRLSGAKEVSQDDFSNGVGTYAIKFDAPPAVKMADISKEIGKYKLEKVTQKLTGKAVEKNKAWMLGATTLTGDMTSKLAELKGKVVIVVGTLTEDAKGKQCLELSSVEEVAKKK
jgi:hypothetical protein